MQKSLDPSREEPQIEKGRAKACGDLTGEAHRSRFESVNRSEWIVYQRIIELLGAVGNVRRVELLNYCTVDRSFTDIITTLKLNPASFKFHYESLQKLDLIDKRDKCYRTTEMGEVLLGLVDTFYDEIHGAITSQ
jgi:hypothetical protein